MAAQTNGHRRSLQSHYGSFTGRKRVRVAVGTQWKESSMEDTIHYFTTTAVPRNPRGVLSASPPSTTHTGIKNHSVLNNPHAVCLRRRTTNEAAVLSLRCRQPTGAGGGYTPCARSDEKSIATKDRSPELWSGAHCRASPPLSDGWVTAATHGG